MAASELIARAAQHKKRVEFPTSPSVHVLGPINLPIWTTAVYETFAAYLKNLSAQSMNF